MSSKKSFVVSGAVAALSLVVMLASYSAWAQEGISKPTPIESGNNKACFACHGPDGMFDADSKLVVSEDKLTRSVHKELNCTDCHSAYTTSPHAKSTPETRVDCLMCHEETVTENTLPRPDAPGKFRESVHWPTGKEMDGDLPKCLSCHSEDSHFIQKPQVWSKKLTAEKCAKCHADTDIMARHNVPVGAARSKYTSFHGKALKLGSKVTATCVDCHNAHGVRRAKDDLATINQANVQKTCQHCHKGTSYNFAMAGTGHLDLTLEQSLVLRITNRFFYGIAIFTFVMLSIALLLDARRRVLNRSRLAPQIGQAPRGVPTFIERWSPALRCQHAILTVSITSLVLTGFPLRFPDARGMVRITTMFGGIEGARMIHRGAALALIVVAIWHLGMLLARLAKTRVHPRDWPMMLNRKDLGDLVQTVRYYLGKRDDLPKYARYSFREKLDYMCEYWGVPIMVLSGLILWFPGLFAERLPGIVISMAYVAHGIEATIAAIVIITWHMYNALVASGFRDNRAWWNGKVTEEYLQHHHPLEWERLVATNTPPRPEPQTGD